MKIKKYGVAIFWAIFLFITIWALFSFVDINMHNTLCESYGQYADWNLFTMIF